MTGRRWIGIVGLLAAMWPDLGAAGDGVIEINQACAVNTGCTPVDTPGFPVRLGPGNHRLTSDLVFSELSTIGIEMLGGETTLDFNGFKLSGDPGTGVIQTGVQANGTHNVVTNGRIEDCDGPCMTLGDHARVEKMMLAACGGPGIQIGEHGIVRQTTIFQGAFDGQGAALEMGATTGYGGNQIAGTGAGAVPVSGGVATALNLCDGEPCTRFPTPRRYYVTDPVGGGHTAAAACAPGFHVASVWELVNPGALQYDGSLGRPAVGSGLFPASGWAYVESGMHCSDYSDPAGMGTVIFPTIIPALQEVGIWGVQEFDCANAGTSVWCIED